MATVTRFEDLHAWQTARQLTCLVYQTTRTDPFARDFGLCDQIRRATVSVMSNVAEGFDSRTQRQFIEFLGRAHGSAGEVRSQAYVALDLAYIDESSFDALYELADKAGRQIHRLIRYLETRPNATRLGEAKSSYEIDAEPQDAESGGCSAYTPPLRRRHPSPHEEP